ncbi:MAG: hypothetical protein HZB26_18645 [Candidatus Hydrogenedentes bacterium]|nr:hypothetical protein [Candidatus Hydrogenedentota bacterium]
MARPVLALLARTLLFSPLTGAAIGCVIAHVAFNSGILWGQSQTYMSLEFTSGFGIAMGGAVGGICGLLAFWPLRRFPLWKAAVYLCGGTLLLALPAALTGNPGAVLSLGASVVGFWAGFCFLYFDDGVQLGEEQVDNTQS